MLRKHQIEALASEIYSNDELGAAAKDAFGELCTEIKRLRAHAMEMQTCVDTLLEECPEDSHLRSFVEDAPDIADVYQIKPKSGGQNGS